MATEVLHHPKHEETPDRALFSFPGGSVFIQTENGEPLTVERSISLLEFAKVSLIKGILE